MKTLLEIHGSLDLVNSQKTGPFSVFCGTRWHLINGLCPKNGFWVWFWSTNHHTFCRWPDSFLSFNYTKTSLIILLFLKGQLNSHLWERPESTNQVGIPVPVPKPELGAPLILVDACPCVCLLSLLSAAFCMLDAQQMLWNENSRIRGCVSQCGQTWIPTILLKVPNGLIQDGAITQYEKITSTFRKHLL